MPLGHTFAFFCLGYSKCEASSKEDTEKLQMEIRVTPSHTQTLVHTYTIPTRRQKGSISISVNNCEFREFLRTPFPQISMTSMNFCHGWMRNPA